MNKHSSFDNNAPEIKREKGTLDDRNFPPSLGMITLVKERFRADVILQNGEPYKNVRYPGPYIDGKLNTAHGRSEPVKMNQLCLVEFINGSYRSPIISRLYPFFAKDLELENLDLWWNKFRSFLISGNDIIDFHSSGYFVRQTTNRIEIYDGTQVLVGYIDLTAKSLQWTGDINVTGNLNVSGKVMAGTVDLALHTHDYTDSPIGPSETGPAK